VKQYPKSIHEVLERGLELKASDIFLTGGEYVAYKCDGRWRRETMWDPLDDGVAEQLILAMTPQPAKRREGSGFLERDMDFSYTIANGFRFRVNLYHIQGRPATVIRPIPTEPPRIDALGLPVDVIVQALKQRTGLILVTGATGSGKSTTLAAMIEWLNETQEIHIVTIEDPIEFYFTPKRAIISQREVGSDTESFAVALRAALRQAPNVIMVGEMRDLETMSAALTAAETGHLVLATLHTGSAPEAIDRVVNAFPEGRRDMVRLQLASSLRLVLTQVLVPKREGAGRALLYEVLVNTPAVATMIRDGKTAQIAGAMQTGAGQGMVTMEQVAAQLVEQGVIAPAAVEGMLRRSSQATGFLGG
jgi:pilus retraction ATPase PilT